MRIFTLWHAGDDGEVPWIIDAVDQYTIDDCEFPPPYLKHRTDINVRELIIDIPKAAIRALFSTPSVRGAVIKDDQRTAHEISTAPASDEIPTASASDEIPAAPEPDEIPAAPEPDELLLTAREFGSGNARSGDVIAAAYRFAAAKLREAGAERHAQDLESAAEKAAKIP